MLIVNDHHGELNLCFPEIKDGLGCVLPHFPAVMAGQF
ncbi:hypothetical protein NC99_18080 [Sunxiuqinia dokdonensis]|uniref:Uncharacterized protein n=1 Tax=Sunxiuqinia dokdonensis TaxID=1409788 RepID=A0A0L8VAH9_9BACT|nr:hypothetical protein NC99_18080 [Sunxiuqinia dokdonensis]